jgi:hypothetical protein
LCFAGFFVGGQPTVAHSSGGFIPNSAELKAERRKPSGEKPCDIQDTPSLTGVLAHFRLHQFNAIGRYASGAPPLGLRRLHAE